ncbi:MAG TPA: TonB-dependent receptor plug domain-containing protein, partial [Sphingomicrobium sp.]
MWSASIAALTTPAWAQQETPEPPEEIATSDEETETIVVTGSRIPRLNLTAVSPVTVVHQDEVKREGVTLTEELLNQLPMVSPGQGIFLSGEATGTSTVDLRGVGAARTLVLVNGRRVIPGDPRDPVPDLNAIPSSLIKRVEVLTGGASSVYGS